MRIALDAMGGDTPQANVDGAVLAAKEWPDVHIILVGEESRLQTMLPEMPRNMSICHADDIILAGDEPVKAIRRKKNASMVVAGRLVKDKQADAMISSGNTGALVTTGLLIIGRIPGIERPALAPMLPTVDGVGLLALDLGAIMDATAENLLQYAIMGSIYRNRVHGIAKPRVGLLNVGTEELKGNELTKAAYPLLQQAPIHFIGNVEARDVLEGNCDVLVCDGFVGNILLKSVEGTASVIFSELKKQFTRTLMSKLAAAILKSGLMRFRSKMDYTEYGGALLLGIDGLCFKSHGSSNANAIKNAVRQAKMAIENNVVASIATELGTRK